MDEDQTSMTASVSKTNGSTRSASSTLPWRDWLNEHGSKLLLFARQQTRSIADAEDVLQDALVKLAKKEEEGSFDGGQAAWLPYLYTSIRRCAIDLGRKEDRRSKREEKVEADRQTQTGGLIDPWFDSESAGDETKQYLEQALKKLPEKFATVITLKIWGEQTFAQIGEQLKISQNTAASRYRYGLEALKKQLTTIKQSGDLL